MNRPLLEMADIVRCAGQTFVEQQSQVDQLATPEGAAGHRALPHRRAGRASRSLHRLRTYDHHLLQLVQKQALPTMPGQRAPRWLKARERELLPTRYVHAVFTLPRELAPLALQNKRLIYNLLFHASAETLLEVARDPRHLGAEIGFFSVLHSWNQRLQFHPHVHCVLAAGGLAPDHSRWISARRSFFLPIGVLSRVFRGKFVAGLRNAFHRGETSVPRRAFAAG